MQKLSLCAALIVLNSPLMAQEFTILPQSIEDKKQVSAVVSATDILYARARIGGTIAGLNIDKGSKVEANARVATVADSKLLLEIKAVDARIASQQAARDQAKLDLDRAQALLNTGAGSQAKADDAKTRLDMAERNLAAIRADRQVIEQRSNEGAVLSPGNGRVLKVNVQDGSVVMPGEIIANIAAENYVLRLQLPERHARFLKLGDKVDVGNQKGEVVLVYPEIEQGRVIADVKSDTLGDYFVGERVPVFISTGLRETIIIPPEYLFRRFGINYVKLANGQEIVVQPGRSTNSGIEILSGLRADDKLVKP